jgi:two-component system, OmpR family, sensor histidine kinase CiaH
MFRSAVLKMTVLYLAIIMVISVFFSINLFFTSVSEVERSVNRGQRFFQNGGRMMLPLDDNELINQRNEQLAVARNNVLWQLVYTNIAILFVAGGISYVFARVTLRPIEAAHEKQKRFTSDASHELRTPLAAMKAEIEVQLRDKNSTKADLADILVSNLEEVEKMQKLVGGLLSLARDDKGKLEITSFPAYTDIENVCNKFRKIKKTKIDNNIEKTLIVTADRTYFSELISILIDNGVKYSSGNVEVSVSSVAHSKQVEIRVTDKGIGISKEDLPHIFDRFYRSDSSRAKEGTDGYGLGLSLAKKIVELHKGEISAKSELGKGTTFIVKLPQ